MNKPTDSDVFLRLPITIANTLKKIAKQEERKITAVAIRALRLYFQKEHGIKIDKE